MSCILSAVIGATIPFFARRFGKFMPADAGTGLARLWHRPRFATPNDPARRKKRLILWAKLVEAAIVWALVMGAGCFCLNYFNLSSFYLVFLYLAGLMAMVDEKIHLLPDMLTIPLLIGGFFGAAFLHIELSPMQSAFGALAGFVLPTAAAFVMTPFRPRSLGGGDFKMLAALGAWMGFLDLSVAILTSFFYFLIIAVIKRKKEGPYGTALFLGALTALACRLFFGFNLLGID